MKVTAFVNGKIYTSFKPLRAVRGLVVAGERVLFAGDDAKALRIARELGGEIIDLRGRTAIPGFVDAHVHLDSLGLSLITLDLRGVSSIEELRQRIRLYIERNPDVDVVIGRGWDQELFAEKRWPTRWDIDDVTGGKPAILIRVCGHAALLNTRALEETGLADVRSPYIVRRADGEPTGIVKEEFVKQAMDRLGARKRLLAQSIDRAQRFAAKYGVTEVGFVSCDIDAFRTLLKKWRRGELLIRVRAYLEPSSFDEMRRFLAPGFGDEYLRVTGLKIILDGSLGARTAWLSEPYNDDPSVQGAPLLDYGELKEIVGRALDGGYQVAIHAIGDAALDWVLKLYKELEVKPDDRARIEHVSVVRPEQLKEIARLGAVAVVQPHFIITDWWVVKRVGRERASWVYAFRSMIEIGIKTAFSTDAPVEPLDPFLTLHAAVTRGSDEGVELWKLTPHEAVDVREALHSYTHGSSYALCDDYAGRLEPGSYGDLVVLSNDPLEVEPRSLRDIRVLETYIGGKLVYASE